MNEALQQLHLNEAVANFWEHFPKFEAFSLPIVPVQKRTGRHSVITKLTLWKLMTAYRLGCSDKEACIYAEIHPATLYRYQIKNREFCEQKEAFKSLIVVAARAVLVEAIVNGNAKVASKYLAWKRPAEFGRERRVC